MVKKINLLRSSDEYDSEYDSSTEESSSLYDSELSYSEYSSYDKADSEEIDLVPSKKVTRRKKPQYVVNPNYEKEWYEYCEKYYGQRPPPIPATSKKSVDEKKTSVPNKQHKEKQKKKSKKVKKRDTIELKREKVNQIKLYKAHQVPDPDANADQGTSTLSKLGETFKGLFSFGKPKYETIDGIKIFKRTEIFEFTSEMKSKWGPTVFSVLSWNILAQRYIESDRGNQLYSRCSKKALEERNRLRLLTSILNQSKCDIICLQEVDRNIFDYCLLPFFASLGYKGVIHCSILKDKTSLPGVATFYSKSVFEETKRIRSHRVLILELLMFNSTKVVVANCHLEANPVKKKQRFNQLRAGLKKIGQCDSTFALIAGDFNSKLAGDNLVSPIENNGFKNSDTVLRQGTCMNAKIDHICTKHMRTIGICRLTEPNSHILPSLSWPSDHFLISSVVKLVPLEDLPVAARNETSSEALLLTELKKSLTEEELNRLHTIIDEENKIKVDLKKSGRKLSKEEISEQRMKSRLKAEFISSLDEEIQKTVKDYIKKKKVKL